MQSSMNTAPLDELQNQAGSNMEASAAQIKEWKELQTIVESSSCGVYKAALLEGVPILYANDGYYAIHDYTRQQFEEELGNRGASLILPQDIQRIAQAIENSLKCRDSKLVLEYRIRRRDGAVAWVHSEINFFSGTDGEQQIAGLVFDITERKELELRLRRTSTLYHIAQKHSRLNMWELDIKNRRIIQTEGSKALHGYGDVVENVPDSLLASGYFHPDTVAEVQGLFDRIYSGRKQSSATYKVKKKDSDTEYWWEKVTYELVPDEDGNAAYAIGVSEDVTEQKETELQRSRDVLLNQMVYEDVLFSIQADLTEDTVLSSWFSERALGFEKAENFSANDLFQYILTAMANPDDAKRFKEQFSEKPLQTYIQNDLDIPSFECRQQTADGHIVWVRLISRINTSAENGHRILTLYARDISKQIQREQRLQQKAERDEESGLYNFPTGRLLIQNILRSRAVSNQNSTLALMKLDGLSSVQGQTAKKELMLSITAQVRAWLPSSCIIARDSEDTFLLFCYGMRSTAERIAVVERIIKEATHPEHHLPDGVTLQTFAGIINQIEAEAEFDQIYHAAFNLLMQAWKNGEPCVVSDEENVSETSAEQQGWSIEKFVEQSWKDFERGTSPDEIARIAFGYLGTESHARRITSFLRLPGSRQLQKQLEWRSHKNGGSLPDLDSAKMGELFLSIPESKNVVTIRPDSGRLYDCFSKCCQTAPVCPAIVCSSRANGILTFCILMEGTNQTPPVQEMESIVSFLRRIYFVNELHIHYKYAALRDPVTSLFNFEGYLKRLQDLQEDTLSSLGMVSVYILNFKEYNRQYSSRQGDAMLQSVAQIMEDIFGANACYRISGATFLAICPDVTYETFMGLYHKLESRMELAHRSRIACASVWEQNAISRDVMKEQLDERIQVAANRLRLENKTAAERFAHIAYEQVKEKIGKGNFVAFLQPKASASTGKVCGAEALIRYQDEERGILPPGEFLKAIEAAGAIREIDLFMLESVCRTMRQWLDAGWKGFPISLNYSRSTLLEPDILEETNRIVERYRIPKELIEIEVTETISSVDSMGLKDIVRRLAQSGYRLAIDDFGADYSNIYVLYLLDIHTLKFDRKIINDIYHNDRARAVVQNLLNLCRQMNIVSVAEGVQSQEQLETLREMSCDLIQGYFINKPIPMDEFQRLYIQVVQGADLHADHMVDGVSLI